MNRPKSIDSDNGTVPILIDIGNSKIIVTIISCVPIRIGVNEKILKLKMRWRVFVVVEILDLFTISCL